MTGSRSSSDCRPTSSFAITTGCQMAHVTALAAARHDVLARRGWDVREHGLAELRFGDGIVMLGTAGDNDFGLKTARELGAVNQGVYVIVDEIDAHYEKAVAAGAEVVRTLHDTDYGSRDYMVRDPEGNLWSVGTYRPE